MSLDSKIQFDVRVKLTHTILIMLVWLLKLYNKLLYL